MDCQYIVAAWEWYRQDAHSIPSYAEPGIVAHPRQNTFLPIYSEVTKPTMARWRTMVEVPAQMEL